MASALKAPVFHAIGALGLVATLYCNTQYITAYRAAHPQDSYGSALAAGLVQFFRDCLASPAMILVTTQLLIASGLINAIFKVESRRNALSLDRLMVMLGYMIAVGPMFAFFVGRVAGVPLHGARAKRSGSFQFRPVMYFTLLNFILAGILMVTPTDAPRFQTLLGVYLVLMIFYLALPHHSAEPTGALTVRAIRQSHWIYGAAAGAGAMISGSAYATYFGTGTSVDGAVAQLFANHATASLTVDYATVVLSFALFILFDDRVRADVASGARIVLVILTPFIPGVTLPLYLLHREGVDAESHLDKLANADNAKAK